MNKTSLLGLCLLFVIFSTCVALNTQNFLRNKGPRYPFVGKAYEGKYNPSSIHTQKYLSNTDVEFDNEIGEKEVAFYQVDKVKDGLYMITWQAKDTSTVSLVADFNRGVSWRIYTSADAKFTQEYGTYKEVQ